jgi:hypothetical protein
MAAGLGHILTRHTKIRRKKEMPLLFQPLTDKKKQLLAAHFLNVKHKLGDVDLMMVDAPPDSVEVSDSHPVYVLGLKDIVEGATLRNAKVSANRCFVAVKNHVSAIEMNAAEATGDSGVSISSINEGPFSVEFLQAVERLSHLSNLPNENYEVRFLLVPAVYVAALWLHSEAIAERDQDLICKLPAPADEQTKLLISGEVFMQQLKGKAEAALKAQSEMGFD